MKVKSSLIAWSSTTLLSSVALAQDPAWLPDRQYREGPGFLVGNFELHPAVGIDVGYDSNFLHRPSGADPIGSVRFRPAASFAVATLGPQRRGNAPQPAVTFRFESGANGNIFVPVSGSDEGKADLRSQNNVDAFGRAVLDIFPGQPWSGHLMAGVTRSTLPTQQAIPGGDTFNRVLPVAAAEIGYTPGGGMLDFHLGYNFSGTFFESSTFGYLNNYHNDALINGRWRFLPRTALIYSGDVGFITYPNSPDASNSAATKTSSHPVRSRLGATGLITPSFGVVALVGWGASFYSAPPNPPAGSPGAFDFNSVIGQAELRWYIQQQKSDNPMQVNLQNSGVGVGFIRDFDDSIFGTYFEKDQGYATFNYLFGGMFLLTAKIAAGALVFPHQQDPDYGQPNGWTDTRVDGNLFAEYRFKDWIGLNAEVDYIGYFSKTSLKTVANEPPFELAFQQIAAFGGLRLFY